MLSAPFNQLTYLSADSVAEEDFQEVPISPGVTGNRYPLAKLKPPITLSI